jgi:hypothetical protein
MRDDSFKITCFSLWTSFFVVSFIIAMTVCERDTVFRQLLFRPRGLWTMKPRSQNDPAAIKQWHWICDFRFMSGSVTLSLLIMDNMDYWALFYLILIHNSGRPRGRSSSPGKVKNFVFWKSSRPALGSTHPPIRWVPRALSPGIKRPGREADHLPPASDEVKEMWIYTSTPPYAFIAECLIR